MYKSECLAPWHRSVSTQFTNISETECNNSVRITSVHFLFREKLITTENREKMQSFSEPYFFEKYFPASYHITFQPPVHRHRGSYNYSQEEMERKSRISTDEFHVFLDVKEYRPDELTVKTINEMVIIEGKQNKRSPNEIPRHFIRHFTLPEFFDSEDVFSTISDDGILEVKSLPASRKKMRHLDELRAADTVNRK